MPPDYAALLDRFRELRLLVIGEAMLDRYLRGSTDRICAEAPVPIVALSSVNDDLGGAANVAANAASLGANVLLASLIGDDAEGLCLLDRLTSYGIDPEPVQVQAGRRTLAKQRVFSGPQMLLRLDQGDTTPPSPRIEAQLVDALTAAYEKSDAVVVSDYAYGVLTPRVVSTLAGLLERQRKPLFVDARDLSLYRHLRPDAVKPNYAEAIRLLGERPEADPAGHIAHVTALSGGLLDKTGAASAAVTLDANGAVLLTRSGAPFMANARSTPGVHGAGAGDSFLAAFALASTAGAEGPVATEVAVAAAAEAVSRRETAVCTRAALWARLHRSVTPGHDTAELVARVLEEKRNGRRIVFTNGCFDIVHSGHAAFLRDARALGDVLVVGLNSDESVARIKGPSRPVNRLEDRYCVLAALESVDYVIPFDDDTPEALISLLAPDVFVKGGDYTREDLPEAALVESLGGTVRIVDYVEDRSTSGLIERITRTAVRHA